MTQATTQEHTIPRTFENLRGARRFRQRLAKMATNMATENTENRGITKAGKVANLSLPATGSAAGPPVWLGGRTDAPTISYSLS
jgi:hypothetical protein